MIENGLVLFFKVLILDSNNKFSDEPRQRWLINEDDVTMNGLGNIPNFEYRNE